MPSKSLPSSPSLDHLKYQARDLLNAEKAKVPEAFVRITEFHPKFARSDQQEIRSSKFSLADAQLVIAREYGFESWPKLKQHVESLAQRPARSDEEASGPARPVAEQYEHLARDLVAAYESGDAGAIQRLNEHRGRSSTWDDVRADVWHRVYKVRRSKGQCFELADAQEFLAREAGFGNWAAFVNAGGAPPPGEAYAIDGTRISPRRRLSDKEWDALIAECKNITNAGLVFLARLPRLREVELHGLPNVTLEGTKAFPAPVRVKYSV